MVSWNQAKQGGDDGLHEPKGSGPDGEKVRPPKKYRGDFRCPKCGQHYDPTYGHRCIS